MCANESAARPDWAEACLAFGELRTSHNETVVARTLSFSIREQALRGIGDEEGAAEVAEERARFNAEAAQTRSLTRIRTHDLDSLWRTTDRVAFLGEHRVIAYGSMNELMNAEHRLIKQYLRGPRGRIAQQNASRNRPPAGQKTE
jgi:hypothetical protein